MNYNINCTLYIFWQLTETDSSVYSRCGARTPADWVRWRVRGGKWYLGGPQRLTYVGRDRHQQRQAGGHLLFFHLLEFSTPGWNNRDHSCEAPTKAGWGSEAVKPGMRYLYHNYSQLTNFYEQEEINKRLSLPADLKLPDNFITRQTASPTLEGPITRYEYYAFPQYSMNTIHPPLIVICWPRKNFRNT